MLREHAPCFRLALLAALVSSAVFLLAGCKQAKASLPSSVDAANIEAYCSDWAKLRNSGFVYENNVWNQGTIQRENRVQCLLTRVVDGKVQYGWRWQWPRGSGNVKAYPEVIYGHKPWFASSTTVNLPRRISTINELTVIYGIEMQARGRYNLAFDVWVTNNARPTPTTITHEIMIWVGDRTRAWEPSPGYLAKSVTIGGATYDLYIRLHAEWLKEHGAPDVTYIAFNARTAQVSGRIDVKQFLDYLTANGYLPADGYVASVELGNEIMNGTGELWLKSYEISVN